jgi:2-aminoadipate transaminase
MAPIGRTVGAFFMLNLNTMEPSFSNRMNDIPKSFIREILKVTAEPDVISFAGGLPNASLFPVEALKKASQIAFEEAGAEMLQYAPSEGYAPLRAYIANRYFERFNLSVNPDRIIILSGSQQGLDLLGKVLINEQDNIIIEEPGYLGAIQAMSLYQPNYHPVPLQEDGIDLEKFENVLNSNQCKLFYTVPNFQNPSGVSYSEEKRQMVAKLVSRTNTCLVEDDPYGELRYAGTPKSSFAQLLPEQTILLGTFSKTVVPGFRLGWIVLPDALYDKVLIAKQAADLHTNNFAQQVMYRYLRDNDTQKHIKCVREAYGKQANAMMNALKKYFPSEVKFTKPEGGMFLWVTLPDGKSALKLFNRTIKKKVAFVPGDPFYINKTDVNTLRLNFSCTPPELIKEGIKRFGAAYSE